MDLNHNHLNVNKYKIGRVRRIPKHEDKLLIINYFLNLVRYGAIISTVNSLSLRTL